MTQEFAMRILNSRITITPAHIGSIIMASVQGNGTFYPKSESNPFDRYIYNLKANSALAMQKSENKKLITSALAAESAGNMEEAAKFYNSYLNAVQVSFNVSADRAVRFASGDDVKASIELVDTKAGTKALVVRNVSKIVPQKVAAIKFNLTDLLTEPEAADELPAEKEEAAA